MNMSEKSKNNNRKKYWNVDLVIDYEIEME